MTKNGKSYSKENYQLNTLRMLNKALNELFPSPIKAWFRKAGHNAKTEDMVPTEILEIEEHQ